MFSISLKKINDGTLLFKWAKTGSENMPLMIEQEESHGLAQLQS